MANDTCIEKKAIFVQYFNLMLMEWSNYNFFFESDKFDCCFVYNSLSNAFLKLDRSTFKILSELKNNVNLEIESSLRLVLIENKILVNSNAEEFLKFKALKMLKRYDKSSLSLTIAPTSDCNFRCQYCFENSPEPIYMNDNTEDKLMQFIQQYKNINYLSITWYGGEPLMAFDRIISITKKIESLNVNFESSIITNGYYLTDEVINSLDFLHVTMVHVTLDGLQEMHNKRRPEKNWNNSFKKIIENIERFKDSKTKAKLVIRINVDKENMGEYHKLYSFLQEKFNNTIVNIYPGFVKKTYGECPCSEAMLLSNEEQASFVIEQYKKYNIIDNSHFLPSVNFTECLARCINAFLISPDGYLYKCWTDLGNTNKSIGNLFNDDVQLENLSKYLVGGDPFSDPQCMSCKFLPICGGGCPHLKLKKIFEASKVDLCHISKRRIYDFLELYYERFSKGIN